MIIWLHFLLISNQNILHLFSSEVTEKIGLEGFWRTGWNFMLGLFQYGWQVPPGSYFCHCHKNPAQSVLLKITPFWMKAAEIVSWDLKTKWKYFGLKNSKQISHLTVSWYSCSTYYFFSRTHLFFRYFLFKLIYIQRSH